MSWISQKGTVPIWTLSLLCLWFCLGFVIVFAGFFSFHEKESLYFFPDLSWSVFLKLIELLVKMRRKYFLSIRKADAMKAFGCNSHIACLAELLQPVTYFQWSRLLNNSARHVTGLPQQKKIINFPSVSLPLCKYCRKEESGFPVGVTNVHHKRCNLLRVQPKENANKRCKPQHQ